MKKQAVGGQAVIEGVMMQSKDKRSIAVRKNDGEIVVKKNKTLSPLSKKIVGKLIQLSKKQKNYDFS